MTRAIRLKLNKVSFIDSLLILLLFFSPFAYGGVHFLSVIIFSFTAVVIFSSYFFDSQISLINIIKIPLIKFSLFIIFIILFQLIPLPQHLLRLITPSTHQLYTEFSLTYASSKSLRSISIYPWATIFELIKIISYGLVFFVILGRSTEVGLREKNFRYEPRFFDYLSLGMLTSIFSLLLHSIFDFNLQIFANALYFIAILGLTVGINQTRKFCFNVGFIIKMVNAIIAIGFIFSVFTIIQKNSYSEGIYWLGRKEYNTFGPYISRSHYAGFMELCTPLAIASFIGSIAVSSFFHQKGIREKVVWFSSAEANKTLLYLFVSAVMSGSLFLSSSRAGISSFVISTFFFFSAMIFTITQKRKTRLFLASFVVVLLIFAIVIWLSPERWLAKFKSLPIFPLRNLKLDSVDMRFIYWRDILKTIKDFPVFGTGLGTFSHIFPRYRTFEESMLFLRYAHSDYLQFVSEMGIFIIIIIIAFFLFLIRRYGQILKRLKRDTEELKGHKYSNL